MRTKELTKEWLKEHNITVEGCKIFYNGRKGIKELKPYVIKGPSKLGTPKKYLGVIVYNKDTQKQSLLLVHRIIYAWYHGVANADLTIDHIDNNTFNNNIENLREISISENVKRREGNGHNDSIYYGMYDMTNEEVDRLKKLSDSINKFKVDNKDVIKQEKSLIRELKRIAIELKEEYNTNVEQLRSKVSENNIYYSLEFKFARAEYEIKRDNLKQQLKMAQDNFHNRVKSIKDKEINFRLLKKLYKERVNKTDKELLDTNYAIEQLYKCLGE